MPFTVAVTVTVCAPPSSVSEAGPTVSVTPDGSASSLVTATLVFVNDRLPDVPLIWAEPSLSNHTLLSGVSVKLPDADAASAGIVMLNPVTWAKPTWPAVSWPATLTATTCCVPKRVAPSTVAVTLIVRAPPSSTTGVGAADSVIPVGAASSSVSAIGAADAFTVTDESPTTLRSISVTELSCSSTASASGTSKKLELPVCAPAAMVT